MLVIRTIPMISLIIMLGIFSSYTQPPLNIGDHYQGGTIFYLSADQKHGYVVDELEFNGISTWGNDESVFCQANSLDNGADNTNKIISKVGKPADIVRQYAAYICNQITREGNIGWYLPSKNEVQLLYKNSPKLNLQVKLTDVYWTSFEEDEFNASAYNFKDNSFTKMDKTSQFKVRAIRQF